MCDARAESRSEHLPLERAQRADSPGRAPNPFLPQGASAYLVGSNRDGKTVIRRAQAPRVACMCSTRNRNTSIIRISSSHQLTQVATHRSGDADAWLLARNWRPQSPVQLSGPRSTQLALKLAF